MLICNIQFPSLFAILIILIYRSPSSSLWSFLYDLSSILESFTSVNTVILCDFNIQINNEHQAYFVFHQLNNIISFDMSTIFDYFNLAYHSLDICIPSIILINRMYSKCPCFNIKLVNPRQLLRRIQCKYASSKLESYLIAYKVFDCFTRKKFSTKSSYFTDMIGSYEISSKQAYKLSFTLVGKTHYSNTTFLTLSIYFQISTRLNLNLISTQNHC